jgi:hAT family C-terminal dimerisation region
VVGCKYFKLNTLATRANKILQYNAQHFHPVWSLLAQDNLAIMSSSVSSKHAFPQGGITISKHHSCLKGDIMEALRCIKCAIQHDLLFREPAPLSTLELEECDEELVDVAGGDSKDTEEESDVEGFSWDELLIEDEDEETMDWSE